MFNVTPRNPFITLFLYGTRRYYCCRSVLKDEVYIVAGSRTPVGSFRKSLSSLSAPLLGSISIKETLKRANCKNLVVDEVLMGQVCQGHAGQAPAKQAAIFAGLPTSVSCTTVNKVCASGMKAIMIGSISIAGRMNEVVIAGGQESMSNVPFYLPRKDPTYGGFKMIDGIVFDGLTDVYNECHMGICAEKTAAKFNITREDQDRFAQMSYERSQKAAKDRIFDQEIIAVPIVNKKETILVSEDEEYKRVDFERFKTLKPAFKENGTITAANASSLNDGAASVLLMSREALDKYHSKPLAKILGFSDGEVDPIDFPIAPSVSIKRLLDQFHLKPTDIAIWEINEAFSVVVLANLKIISGIDLARVNVHGGAVSIGHPIGMSGTRITLHLAFNLKPGQKGIASICNGGGGSSSILIEGC